MDLRIKITDENDFVLQDITVYQDGSDSDGAETIAAFIRASFDIDRDKANEEQENA
jgi:hypothetical protein